MLGSHGSGETSAHRGLAGRAVRREARRSAVFRNPMFGSAAAVAKHNPVSERIAVDSYDVVDTDFVQLPQYEHRAGHFDAADYLII